MDNIITKNVNISVNITAARKLLNLAGFYKTKNMTDEEIFYIAIGMSDCYGVSVNDDNWQEFIDNSIN